MNTTSASTDEDRWAAVVARDDADFYYSVRTTGVYCRPSCAARRPRRENVAFHATTADAERAGFRPCRRCRPDEAPAAERRAAAIAAACRAIEAATERLPVGRRPGRGRRHEPVALPPGVQGGHRR